jgi:sugar lactone lactonase YvrE
VADDGTVYIGTQASGATYGARVWRIDPLTGIITTYAGGEGAFSDAGNGRVATDATLSWPHDLALDPLTGDLLIHPGANNQTVRRVNGAGVIDIEIRTSATCAATGVTSSIGPSSAMTLGPDGTIYLSNQWTPEGCSEGGEQVLAWRPDGTAVATSRVGTIFRPEAMAVDAAGNLFLWAGTPLFELLKVDRLGRVTTVLGTGAQLTSGEYIPAVDASAARIDGIAAMPNGDLWIADVQSHSVRVIRGAAATAAEPLPAVTITLETAGPFSASQLQAVAGGVRVIGSAPGGVEGILVRAEPVVGHLVAQASPFFEPSGGLDLFPYGGLGPAPTSARVLPLTREREPIMADAIAFDVATTPTPGGLIYGVYNVTGTTSSNVDIEPSPVLQVGSTPVDVSAGPDGSLYVVDNSSCRIFRIDETGALEHVAGNGDRLLAVQEASDPRTQPFSDPTVVAATADGDVFVGTNIFGDDTIWRIDAVDGLARRFAGGGASAADGIAALSAEISTLYRIVWDEALQRLYIADGNRLRYVEGGLIFTVPLQLGGCGVFTLNGLALMPNGNLAIGISLPGCMTFSNQRAVLEVDPSDGSATELTVGLSMPGGEGQANGLAVATDGTVYLDLTDSIVRRDTDGSFTVVTGPGTWSTTNADSSLATQAVGPAAPVGNPRALTLGVDGTLYVAENTNGLVRAISDPANVP